nr:hypothetical protein [Tanacetum cinerariifolium]
MLLISRVVMIAPLVIIGCLWEHLVIGFDTCSSYKTLIKNEPDDVKHASVKKDNHHGYTTRVDEHFDNDNSFLENVASIGEDIHNDFVPWDSMYDANSSENEEVNDYANVMMDEENEIHEASVEVHFFGLKESGYQFNNIGVSSEVPDNVFMEKYAFKMDIDVFDTDLGGEGDCPS